MINAERFKLRTHRTPLVCAVVLLAGVLAPSIALIWYDPPDPSMYTDNFTDSFEALSVLLAVVFGGWLLGTEYRQGTVKRLLSTEPRRVRAFATKGAVGAGAMSVALSVTAVVGWAAARLVGSMNDVVVSWDGREMLAGGITALIAATVSYSLSAVTRSDAFAMVGTLALILILEPLLGAIPRVGTYSMGSALDGISVWIAGDATELPDAPSIGTAALTLVQWLGACVGGGVTLFARRDV